MQDKFWTPELLCEFFNSSPDLPPTLMNEINLFKSSKSPKKEWEVVAFRAKGDNDIYKLQKDGRYRSDMLSDRMGYRPEEFLSDGSVIHSVRRLSDGIIFSCQEKVKTPYAGDLVIHSFEIIGQEMIARFTNGHPSNGYCNINGLSKLPQPTLTTVDGVEITDLTNFFPTVLFEDGSMNVNCDRATWDNEYAKANGKLFSTREAAEEYILSNRPLLSLNDVKEAIGSNDVFGTLALRERLTALVKQKLNQ